MRRGTFPATLRVGAGDRPATSGASREPGAARELGGVVARTLASRPQNQAAFIRANESSPDMISLASGSMRGSSVWIQ